MQFMKIAKGFSLFVLLPVGLMLAGAAGASWALIGLGKDMADNSNWFETPNGVDEQDFVTLGDFSQYIRIRGRDRANPVLLDLHGGPGGAMSGMNHRLLRPLTEYFTVVEWDQRGAGKSAGDDALIPTMTYERMVDDAIELIEHLRARLNVEKVVLVGHSWGSMLGLGVIKKRPDLVSAYVGVGQALAWNAGLDETQRLLLEAATAADDEKTVEELSALPGSWPPKGDTEAFMERVQLIQGKLPAYKKGLHAVKGGNFLKTDLFLDAVLSPELDAVEFLDVFGKNYPTLALIDDLYGRDLRSEFGRDYRVPIFMFQGEHDWQTPTTLVKPWFAELSAPYKEYIAFEDSAHFVYTEQPGRYVVELVNKVRPLALRAGADRIEAAAAN